MPNLAKVPHPGVPLALMLPELVAKPCTLPSAVDPSVLRRKSFLSQPHNEDNNDDTWLLYPSNVDKSDLKYSEIYREMFANYGESTWIIRQVSWKVEPHDTKEGQFYVYARCVVGCDHLNVVEVLGVDLVFDATEYKPIWRFVQLVPSETIEYQGDADSEEEDYLMCYNYIEKEDNIASYIFTFDGAYWGSSVYEAHELYMERLNVEDDGDYWGGAWSDEEEMSTKINTLNINGSSTSEKPINFNDVNSKNVNKNIASSSNNQAGNKNSETRNVIENRNHIAGDNAANKGNTASNNNISHNIGNKNTKASNGPNTVNINNNTSNTANRRNVSIDNTKNNTTNNNNNNNNNNSNAGSRSSTVNNSSSRSNMGNRHIHSRNRNQSNNTVDGNSASNNENTNNRRRRRRHNTGQNNRNTKNTNTNTTVSDGAAGAGTGAASSSVSISTPTKSTESLRSAISGVYNLWRASHPTEEDKKLFLETVQSVLSQ